MSWRESIQWSPLLLSVETSRNPDARRLYDAAIAELIRLARNYRNCYGGISLMTDFSGRVVAVQDTGERANMERYVAWTMDNLMSMQQVAE